MGRKVLDCFLLPQDILFGSVKPIHLYLCFCHMSYFDIVYCVLPFRF